MRQLNSSSSASFIRWIINLNACTFFSAGFSASWRPSHFSNYTHSLKAARQIKCPRILTGSCLQYWPRLGPSTPSASRAVPWPAAVLNAPLRTYQWQCLSFCSHRGHRLSALPLGLPQNESVLGHYGSIQIESTSFPHVSAHIILFYVYKLPTNSTAHDVSLSRSR